MLLHFSCCHITGPAQANNLKDIFRPCPAAVLLAGGAKGKRFALQHSRIMLHQPHVSGVGGQATDIEIHAREILKTREEINVILQGHTGQELSKVQDDTERDYWLSAEEGKEYGVIDEVLASRSLEAVAN